MRPSGMIAPRPVSLFLLISALLLLPATPGDAYLMSVRQGQEGPEVPNANDFLGWAVATGDFNGDGFDDLAMGAPSEDEDVFPGREHGAVVVNFGSARGITHLGPQWLTVGAIDETIVHYGIALAAGNFNNDAYDDLAVGLPDYDGNMGAITSSGRVWIHLGGPTGLSTAVSLVIDEGWAGEPLEAMDRFGAALAVGRFDPDEFDDLAVGAPGEDGGSGAVYVFSGSAGILATGGTIALRPILLGSTPEADGEFGAALAAGHIFGGPEDDLAIGAPKRDVAGNVDAGQVYMAAGSASGITTVGAYRIDELELNAQIDDNGEFGSALTIGHFWDDTDSPNQLAIGAPGHLGCAGAICGDDVGLVYVLHDSLPPFGIWSYERLVQSDTGNNSENEIGDRFGHSLDAGDWDDDGFEDLAVGAPSEDIENVPVNGFSTSGAGQVFLWVGGDSSFDPGDASTFHGRTLNDTLETSAQVGWALAFGNFDDSGRANLAIGAPTKDFRDYVNGGATNSAGSVYVLAPWRQVQGRPHRSSVAYDCDGRIVFAQRPFQGVTPASVTKALTVLIAVEAIQSGEIDSNAVITIPDWVANNVSGSSAGLTTGQQIRFVDLIKLAVSVSAGDACYAIGDTLTGGNHTWNGLSGTIVGFNNRMNIRAAELGMDYAQFNNPSGRPLAGHFSGAIDWVEFARQAMENPLFRYFVGTRVWADIPNWPVTGYGWLQSTQDSWYATADGVKPGNNGLSLNCGLWSADDPVFGRYETSVFGVPSTQYGSPATDSRAATSMELLQLSLAECDLGLVPPPPGGDPVPIPWARFPDIPTGPATDPPHCFLFAIPSDEHGDALIEVYAQDLVSSPAAVELTICRTSEITLGPGESAVLSVDPVRSHSGFRIFNVLRTASDLLLTTTEPGGSQAVNLASETEHLVAAESPLTVPYALTIQNTSSISGARLQVDELGYTVSGVTSAGSPFSVSLGQDPHQSEEVIKVCVDGQDPTGGNTAILLVRPRTTTVVSVDPLPVISGASGLELRAPLPNPFRNGTTLAYETSVAGPLWITIHDVSGRRVRVLTGGAWLEAGTHVTTWDGRDDEGRTLPAGVYFQRVRTSSASATARVVLLP